MPQIYVFEFFWLYLKTGRNFDKMAERCFVERVAQSWDNHVRHGHPAATITYFSEFWLSRKGYDGVESLDDAINESLAQILEVRPVLLDVPRVCGAGPGVCERPRQRCDTCGTFMRCSKHCGNHTKEDCHEIFWATHSTYGQRTRTMCHYLPNATQSSKPVVLI